MAAANGRNGGGGGGGGRGAKSLYERLVEQNAKWCRYCGTTTPVHWRGGPWGPNTLCNRHGCDYKGYGATTSRTPRLDLSVYENEDVHLRTRPVVQDYCCICGTGESDEGNPIVMCDGCPWAYHQHCRGISDADVDSGELWFCTAKCAANLTTLQCEPQMEGHAIPHHLRSAKIAVATSPRPSVRTVRSKKAESPVRKHSSDNNLMRNGLNVTGRSISVDSFMIKHHESDDHAWTDEDDEDATPPMPSFGVPSIAVPPFDFNRFTPFQTILVAPVLPRQPQQLQQQQQQQQRTTFSLPALHQVLPSPATFLSGTSTLSSLQQTLAPPSAPHAPSSPMFAYEHQPTPVPQQQQTAPSHPARAQHQPHPMQQHQQAQVWIPADMDKSAEYASMVDTMFHDTTWESLDRTGLPTTPAAADAFGVDLFSERLSLSGPGYALVSAEPAFVPFSETDDTEPFEEISDLAYQQRHAALEHQERVDWQVSCRALGTANVAHHTRPWRLDDHNVNAVLGA